MRLIVDGTAYDYTSRPTNRDVMALEEALGVTFASWGKRFQNIGKMIQQARDAAPDGVEPDLSDVESMLSMRDMTAMVFLARRMAGERNLKFDDVEFTDVQIEADAEEGLDEPLPDPNVDPTAGSSAPTPGPLQEPSPASA